MAFQGYDFGQVILNAFIRSKEHADQKQMEAQRLEESKRQSDLEQQSKAQYYSLQQQQLKASQENTLLAKQRQALDVAEKFNLEPETSFMPYAGATQTRPEGSLPGSLLGAGGYVATPKPAKPEKTTPKKWVEAGTLGGVRGEVQRIEGQEEPVGFTPFPKEPKPDKEKEVDLDKVRNSIARAFQAHTESEDTKIRNLYFAGVRKNTDQLIKEQGLQDFVSDIWKYRKEQGESFDIEEALKRYDNLDDEEKNDLRLYFQTRATDGKTKKAN